MGFSQLTVTKSNAEHAKSAQTIFAHFYFISDKDRCQASLRKSMSLKTTMLLPSSFFDFVGNYVHMCSGIIEAFSSNI